MMEGIADDLCRVRLARQTCVLLLKPGPELCDKRGGFRLPDDAAFIGTAASDPCLDPIKLGNPRNGFGGNRRIAALGDFEEVPPKVAPAKGDHDPVGREVWDGA